jgi:hypothetical protein
MHLGRPIRPLQSAWRTTCPRTMPRPVRFDPVNGGQKPSWRDAAGPPQIEAIDSSRHRWVTQIGGRTFNEHPRWHREISLSVLVGRYSAKDAVRVSFRRSPLPQDRVRFFRTVDLLRAEYLPHTAPTRGNPDHACIRAPITGNDLKIHQAWWARPERVTLQTMARY